MTMTKKEAATALAGKGIALPDNWSKLSTERAVKWSEDALALVTKAPAPKKVGIIAHGVNAVMGGLAALGATLAPAKAETATTLDSAAKKNAKAKVFSDPNYVRSTNTMRKMMDRYRRVGCAADPVPMTRQVARRKALDAGLKASEFRRFMGV